MPQVQNAIKTLQTSGIDDVSQPNDSILNWLWTFLAAPNFYIIQE